MTRYRFLPAAEAELGDAVAWYEAARPGLGATLLDEVESILNSLVRHPNRGTLYLAGTRRVILHKLPYSLVYRQDPDGIVVTALAHHRRRPGYWKGRLVP